MGKVSGGWGFSPAGELISPMRCWERGQLGPGDGGVLHKLAPSLLGSRAGDWRLKGQAFLEHQFYMKLWGLSAIFVF